MAPVLLSRTRSRSSPSDTTTMLTSEQSTCNFRAAEEEDDDGSNEDEELASAAAAERFRFPSLDAGSGALLLLLLALGLLKMYCVATEDEETPVSEDGTPPSFENESRMMPEPREEVTELSISLAFDCNSVNAGP